MVDFNLRLGKSKNAENINLNDMKSGLSQKDVTNTNNTSIFSEDQATNRQRAVDYNIIFGALDNGGTTKGVLEQSEIDSLKDKVKEYSKNDTFSKREAGNLLKSLGLKNIKAETFFGFLKDVVGLSANIDSAETDDQGNTTVKYAAKEGSQQTVTKNSAGDVTQTRIDNLEDGTFVIKDSSGKIVKGKDSTGEYTRTELENNSYRINRGEEYADYTDIDGQQVEIGGKDKNGEYTRTQLENGGFRIQRGDNYKDFSVVDGKQVEVGGKDKDGEYTRTELDNGNYMLTRKNPDSLKHASTEYTYDDKGTHLRTTYKDVDGKITETDEYIYDDKGNELSWIEKDADGRITYSQEYTYDDKGNKVSRSVKYEDDSYNYSTEYTYDDKGNKLSEITKFADGSIESSDEYSYDDKGNQLSTTNKDADGRIFYSEEYTYDDKGNKLSTTRKYADGSISSYSTEYTYDDKGNQLSEITKWVDGSESSIEHTYDDKGNELSRTKKDADGRIKWTCEYTYDDKGNKLIRDVEDGNNSISFNGSKYLKWTQDSDMTTGAKNGESFDETMKRLGIKDEDREVFRKANKKAEARGWFMVGELDVTIPKELAEKLDLFNHPEKIAFDVYQEEDNYKWQQEQKAKQ